MSSYHDSALGSDVANSAGPLATADALAVTLGDLVVAQPKWESGTTTVDVDSGASTPLFSVANAVRVEAGGLSICSALHFWIATATGTINPRFTLGAAKDFREFRVASYTPSPGMMFVLASALGNINAADGPNLLTAISAGTASAVMRGVGIVAIALNGSRTITPGAGWVEPVEFNPSTSAHMMYQLIGGPGTITGDCTLSAAVEWIDQLALFNEVPGPAIRTPFRRSFGRRRTRYGI